MYRVLFVEDDKEISYATGSWIKKDYGSCAPVKTLRDFHSAKAYLNEVFARVPEQFPDMCLFDINLRDKIELGERTPTLTYTEWDGLRLWGCAHKIAKLIPADTRVCDIGYVLYTGHNLADRGLDEFTEDDAPFTVVEKASADERQTFKAVFARCAEQAIRSLPIDTLLSLLDLTSEQAGQQSVSIGKRTFLVEHLVRPLQVFWGDDLPVVEVLRRIFPRNEKAVILSRWFKPNGYVQSDPKAYGLPDATFNGYSAMGISTHKEELMKLPDPSKALGQAKSEAIQLRPLLLPEYYQKALEYVQSVASDISYAGQESATFKNLWEDHFPACFAAPLVTEFKINIPKDAILKNKVVYLEREAFRDGFRKIALSARENSQGQVNIYLEESASSNNVDVNVWIVDDGSGWDSNLSISDAFRPEDSKTAFAPSVSDGHRLSVACKLLQGYCHWRICTRNSEGTVRHWDVYRSKTAWEHDLQKMIERLPDNSGTVHWLSFTFPHPL